MAFLRILTESTDGVGQRRRVFWFDEVASALNRSPSYARVLWTRAVRKLSEILAESEPSESWDGDDES